MSNKMKKLITEKARVEGMGCQSWLSKIQQALLSVKGVEEASVSLSEGMAGSVTNRRWSPGKCSLQLSGTVVNAVF